MSSICMTFVPLASISPDADTLQDSLRESIKAGMAAGKYSAALEKQFQIQLRHIDAKEPSCEIVLTQTFSTKPSKVFLVPQSRPIFAVLIYGFFFPRSSETRAEVHHDG